MVPVIPIYLLMYALTWFYNHPWVYYKDDNGRTRRYKKKREFHVEKGTIKDILLAFIVPPTCFAVWFGIISFIVMVYLTAGFEQKKVLFYIAFLYKGWYSFIELKEFFFYGKGR